MTEKTSTGQAAEMEDVPAVPPAHPSMETFAAQRRRLREIGSPDTRAGRARRETEAISPQRPDGSLSMQETHDLSFPVLSDPGNVVASALGSTISPDDVIAAQREPGLDLGEINAGGTTAIPMPATVVADDGGTHRWVDEHPDSSTRSEVPGILAALDEVIGR